MIPQKPYCFVCYNEPKAAATAKEKLTGHLLREGKDPSQNIHLYLFFVASAPSHVSPSSELPPGLLLFEEFITGEMEQKLLKRISFEEHDVEAKGSSLKHREVKHFGYEFKYGINNVDPSEPLAEGIPKECNEFLQRAVETRIVAHFPDQLTVNKYLPGQGIPPHVDTPSAFEDGIMSLSCGSQVIMDFRHPDGRHLSVLLPPRSLLVMTGESRYIWSHGITPRKSDIIPSPAGGGLTLAVRGTRTSFTFRKLSATAGVIPTDEKESFMPKTDKEASALESQHVHSVYEEIADHFSDTRHKPWPQIADFLRAQQPGSVLVDIGCGNGKYLSVNPHLCKIGSDRSEKLAGICKHRGFQVFVADVLAIPVRSGSVDVGLCIAVIHHLSTKVRRKQAIEELVRILRPGGHVLIYVWAQEQEKDNKKSKYLKSCREYKQEQKQDAEKHQEQDQTSARKSSESELESKNMPKQNQISDECDNSVEFGKGNVHRDNLKTTELEHNFNGLCARDIDDSSANPGTLHQTGELSFDDSSNSNLSQYRTDSKKLQVHVNRTEFKEQDMLVPWQLKKASGVEMKTGNVELKECQTFHRYYHVFKQGELDSLCAEVTGCVVNRSYYDQGNWCVELEKC
ncbi:hypothetical protein V1264_004645 [Littorina saxatilis]|uniref:Fe2OG dioxygenase domain-containing protein n=2 Tax=Littorina saxatilis TaxID=31220 RepID=A0AAN9B2I9_9CAEN